MLTHFLVNVPFYPDLTWSRFQKYQVFKEVYSVESNLWFNICFLFFSSRQNTSSLVTHLSETTQKPSSLQNGKYSLLLLSYKILVKDKYSVYSV